MLLSSAKKRFEKLSSRRLKKSASGVLTSKASSTYPRGYASGPSLAAALLDSLFEQPAGDPALSTYL